MPVISGLKRTIGTAIVPGGAVGADLEPVPGISFGDGIVSARHVSDDLATNADITADVTVPSDGTINVAVTDTTGGFVVVVFNDGPIPSP